MGKRLLVISAVMLFSLLLGAADKPVFYFFHSETCPHCIEAMPFINELKTRYPKVEFKYMEISRDLVNREIYKKKLAELGLDRSGVPCFVMGKKHVMGYKKGVLDAQIIEMIDTELKAK